MVKRLKMHKEEILQMITAFVIALVINIPIAYAGLTHPRVYGEDNVRGYVKNENDEFTFEVSADIGGETINREQVRLGGYSYNTGVGFSSCTENAYTGYYDCRLEDRDLSSLDVCPGFTHSIKLYSSAEELFSTTSVESVCDNKKPDVITFQPDKSIYDEDDVIQFSVNIRDKANVVNKCSGIKRASLVIGSYSQHEHIDTGPGECVYSGVFSVNANSLLEKNLEGNLVARLTAYDNFDLSNSKSVNIITDFSEPTITDIEITKTDGSEVGYYIQNKGLNVDIKVDFIEDNGIDADYAKLNSEDLDLTNIKADSCTSNHCVWSNKRIKMKKSNPSIRVDLRDIAGNDMSGIRDYSFTTDTTEPVITDIEITTFDENDVGYYIPNKRLNVDIKVDFTEEESGIDANYARLNSVHLDITTNPKADSCSDTQCVWDNIWIEMENPNPEVTVSLRDIVGNEVSEIRDDYSFTTDDNAPDMTSIKITDEDGNELGYYIADQELYVDIKVNFTEGETGIDADYAELNSDDLDIINRIKASSCSDNQCVWDNVWVKTRESTPTITVTLQDIAGNYKSETRTYSFVEDNTDPSICCLNVTDTEGEKLGWNNGKNVDVVVSVNITESESGLDESKIKADLSVLNDVLDYNDLARTRCNTQGNHSICMWEVKVKIESETEQIVDFEFFAEDASGNDVEESFYYDLLVDNKEPVFVDLISNHYFDGDYYIGKDTEFIASITEDGVGVNETKIYLDLSEIGLGNKNADNCTEGWECYWGGIGAAEGDGSEVTITLSGEDDLGNEADDLPKEFVVDTTDPVFTLDISNEPEINVLPEFPTRATTLKFYINVTEKNLLKVEVNTTEISETGGLERIIIEDDCSEDGLELDKYRCYLEVGDLKTEFTEEEINVIATDAAGNKAVEKVEVKIYEYETMEVPDYFEIEEPISYVPDFIDKQAASKIPISVFINPKIKVKEEYLNNPLVDPEIISIERADCSQTEHLSHTGALLNEYTYEPYIHVKTATSIKNVEEEEFEIKCNLTLIVKAGERVYQIPEYEGVEVEVDLYNLPLGTISENVEKKLETTLEEIHNLEENIETWEKYTKLLKVICGIGEVAATIDAAITSALGVLDAVSCALEIFGIGKAIWTPSCKAGMKAHGFIIKWLWNPDLYDFKKGGIGLYPGMWIKWACYITHGRLCDANLWAQLGGNAVSYGLEQLFAGKKANLGGLVAEIEGEENVYIINYVDEEGMAHPLKIIGWDSAAQTIELIQGETVKVKFNSDNQLMLDDSPLPEPQTETQTQSPDYRQIGLEDYQSRYVRPWDYEDGFWDYTGDVTTLLDIPRPEDWEVDPYKSKHYATRCWHLPAIVYNLKKERQIKCRYWQCLKDASTNAALPITACDIMQKEMNCLYIESAYFPFQSWYWFNWKEIFENMVVVVVGNMLGVGAGEIMDMAMNDRWDNLKDDPTLLLQTGLGVLCSILSKGDEGITCEEPCSGFPSVVCVMEQGLRGWGALNDIKDGGFDIAPYEAKLAEIDYCEGVE